MACFSFQPRDPIFVKGYGFLSIAKNMSKNDGKNISKNLSGKYSQKLLNHAKQSATDALKTISKRAIQKTAEATGDLTGCKIDDRISKVSKTRQQNNSEIVTNEHDKEILNERYIMEYQKIINLLNNTANQTTKFRTENRVEINDNARGTSDKDSQIKFKTSLLKSSLCDYSDPYIVINGTITVAQQAGSNPNNVDKKVVFKNCAPFTDCISEINNAQIENGKDFDVVMSKYNLIEYSNNYSKTSGRHY